LRIEAHPTGVRAVVFSPRGDYLATAGRDGSIKLWSPDSGRLLNAFRPPGAYARCLALADDGKLIAFGTTDNLVGVCDPHTGHVLWTGRHQNQVFSLAVSPDGTLLASSGADHCVIVWDIHTGAQVCKLTAFTSWPEAVAFAPNQPILAVAGGVERWEIRFFQIPSGQHVRTLSDQGGGIRALAYSRDGKMLAAGGWDRLVRVLDAETGELLYPLMAHTGRVNAVAFSTDGHTLASGSADRTVRLWDLRRPAAPTNGRQQFHHGDAAQVLSAAFTADGQTLVARHQDHAIRLRDAATGRLLAEQTGFAESISALAVGPHGTIASGVHHLIHIWSGRPTDAPTVLDGHQNYVVGIAWSADDRFLVSGDDAGAAILWDVHTATRLRTFSHLTRLVSAVAISGDAQTVATGNELGQLLLWNAATDHPVHTIAAHSGNVSVIQFSRDPAGRLIATGGSDELVKLFDGRTGDFLREFPARSGLITALVFSPDGRRLASGSVDGSVQVWDTQTGEQVAYLPCDDLICALWFDPTGKKLHAADAGGATHVPHTYLLELMND
jgi:WD40 repeat protein